MKCLVEQGDIFQELVKYKDALIREEDESWIECEPSLVPSIIHEVPQGRYVYYISDIHLDHKILKKYPKGCSDSKIKEYIRQIVLKMYEDSSSSSVPLLIAGDISHSRAVSEFFLEQISEHHWDWNVLYVLGNHELWGTCNNGLSLKQIQSEYDAIARKNKVALLDCSILLFKWGKHVLINYDNFCEATDEELRDFFTDSYLIVLGGTGFAGRNEEFNADQDIYRGTIERDEEIALSNRFNAMYERLATIASDLNVIVLTHMPKKDWGSESYVPKWIYVNGHTHKNQLILEDGKTVYADNQVGYYGKSIFLKRFVVGYSYDVFRDYNDGIHSITRDQFLDFYHGMRISASMNRSGKLTLLKRSGLYLFIFTSNAGKNYVMNGGIINKAEHTIDYYYEHMVDYATRISLYLDGYNGKLRELANLVKNIGGSGRIHGCIVDITFWSHIYLNPIDGTITPYYATDMIRKYVYDSVQSLLSDHSPDLLEQARKSGNLPDTWVGKPTKKCQLYESTDIYRYSRIIKGYQYCTDNHVIRRWDDVILNHKDSMIKDGRVPLNLLE